MAARYFIYVALCLFAASAQGLQTVNGKIKVTVGTTAGCGDTVTFMANQLSPTYALYKDFLELEFVPWGRTVRHEDGSFTCQFNQHNCWANRLHRCALSMLKDQDAQLEYMNCEFASRSPSFHDGSYQCAHEAGLNLVDIDNCVTDTSFDEIDQQAEARGTQLTQGINFIPSIVLNDNIDSSTHWSAFRRLQSMVCLALADDPTTGVTDCTL